MDASLVETHVSIVFFVGDRAYKLKKPVHFDFVDQSTVARRKILCDREVELNRRLAPDIYEGVATLVGPDGLASDHLVVMKRLPPDRRLSTLVAEADSRCTRAIDDVAAMLARFHAGADRGAPIDACADRSAVAALWEANFSQMVPFVDSLFDRPTLDRAVQLSSAFIAGRDALFDERIDGGFICDGHGDLLTDDIFILDDGPRIIDCLEFVDRLRFADVVADLAFLVMDLERIGATDLAQRFVDAYEAESASNVRGPLLDLWVAYRAQVRSMVAGLRWQQDGDEVAADRAHALLDLCVDHLERASVRLVLVGGLPGTGKSTVARELADQLGWPILRSDVVRKELAGLGAAAHAAEDFGEGIYSSSSTERTYAEILGRARRLLARGQSVIIDASFGAERHRQAARDCALQAGAAVVELRCEVPREVAERRIEHRRSVGTDASDADPAIAARLAEVADPWPTSIAISTSGPLASSVARTLAAVRPPAVDGRRLAPS